MADTPDSGAAWTEAIEAHAEAHSANEAFEADNENEDLKTAYETAKQTATEKRAAYDGLFEKVGDWPEDWREKYIGSIKDSEGKELDSEASEKLGKRLQRYASPQAALDAMISAQNKISSGQMTNKLTKDSTPEEVAEWRKENNVPEEAKGYDLSLNEGLVVGEDDKELVNGFLDVAHGVNFSQQQVSAALNWHYKNEESLIAARHEADETHRQAAEEELRAEYGSEYQPNRNLLANYLSTFGEGVAGKIVGARLADGTPFPNDPEIVRSFVSKAREANPAGALVPGTGARQMEAIGDEIDALEKEMGTPEWFKDKKKQDRYVKLVAARDKIKEK